MIPLTMNMSLIIYVYTVQDFPDVEKYPAVGIESYRLDRIVAYSGLIHKT